MANFELHRLNAPHYQILFVEDDPVDARLLATYLSEVDSFTAELHHVVTLAETCELISQRQFDLVLLDLFLPDSRGIDTYANLNCHALDVPIVIMTGLDDQELALKAVRQGAQDYLVKGRVESELLGRTIRYAVERKASDSERARLVRELAAKERLATIGQTVAGISHSVKNIVQRLKGSQGIIRHFVQSGEREKLTEMWPIFDNAFADIERFIMDMLKFSKDHVLELSVRNLNEEVQRVIALCQNDARQRGLHLICEFDSSLPLCRFDSAAIHDVLLNLLSNAMDASEHCGSTIRVSTHHSEERGGLWLVVEDDGPGIDEELQSNIFDAFFSTKGSKGTGLGLAMVHKTILTHKGTIELHSEPGRTVFSVFLPYDPSSPGLLVEQRDNGEHLVFWVNSSQKGTSQDCGRR